jgi:hypothetical protein
MSTAASTAAVPLRPHRQREQNQAKRRYGQPAPHAHIIAQFDSSRSGEKPGSYQRVSRVRIRVSLWRYRYAGIGKGHGFTACGKTRTRTGFGKGTTSSRAVKPLKMCPRFSSLRCASCALDDFFRSLFSRAAKPLKICSRFSARGTLSFDGEKLWLRIRVSL